MSFLNRRAPDLQEVVTAIMHLVTAACHQAEEEQDGAAALSLLEILRLCRISLTPEHEQAVRFRDTVSLKRLVDGVAFENRGDPVSVVLQEAERLGMGPSPPRNLAVLYLPPVIQGKIVISDATLMVGINDRPLDGGESERPTVLPIDGALAAFISGITQPAKIGRIQTYDSVLRFENFEDGLVIDLSTNLP